MHLLLFCTMTNKYTIISQIITFLHVSTLSCHSQGTCNQYLVKLCQMGVGQRQAPAALIPGKTRYPLYRRLGGPQERFGRVRKILPPTGIRSPDRPARSESLYRLSYRSPPASVRFQHQCDVSISLLPMHATCLNLLFLLDMIILIISHDDYKSRSLSLYSFIQPPAPSSLLGSNISLSTLFLKPSA